MVQGHTEYWLIRLRGQRRPPPQPDPVYRDHLCPCFRRGDDTVGNPHRAQIYKFELFELIPLLKLDKQLLVEQFEATVSQSTVPSTTLTVAKVKIMKSQLLKE